MDRFRKNYSGCFSLAVIIAVIICLFLTKDTGTTAAVRWLAVVFSVSFFMRPFMRLRTLKCRDDAFALRFGLGLFLCFFVAWNLSALGLCDYSDGVVFTSFAVLAAIGYLIKRFVLKEQYVTVKDIEASLKGFAVFAVIFLIFFWAIGFNPIVDPGTENYMDFGFLQTIYRQKSAFPTDPWFSGTKLNYYYLGQSITIYMCRLALTTPEYGYNMMLATFTGMVFTMTYELVSGMASALLSGSRKPEMSSHLGGVVGAALAAFCANPHWFIFRIVVSLYRRLTGKTDKGYWFPDGTVYINAEFGDPDNGKNEFPAYSVILGDLHAHVINVIFVLPLLALLFDHCFSEKEKEDRVGHVVSLTLISMLLGYYKCANYWDFAIYFVITGAAIVFADIKRKGINTASIRTLAVKAGYVTAVSFISPLPFTLHFAKMESGIGLCENHSPAFKFAVLWLLPLAVTVCLIIYIYTKGAVYIKDKAQRAGLLAFMLCTIGLIIVPEVVYVKDIYTEVNSRFNTMFKLTYQAYILFSVIAGIAFAMAICRILSEERVSVPGVVVAVLMSMYTILSSLFIVHAGRQWFGNFTNPAERKGISSLEYLRDDPEYGFEMTAYDILMQDDSRQLNIIEMAGDSYRHTSALSVYSGACTPLGWYVHEWMWHNDPEPVKERADEIWYFYTCGDEEYCRSIIKKYDIDYVFVGPAEVCKYPVNRNGFWRLGDVCCETIWKDVDLALIKIDKSRL